MERARLNLYLRPETKRRIEDLAKKLGKTQGEVAHLAVDAGLDLLDLSTSEKFAIMVAKNPEFIEELQRIAYEAQINERREKTS